MKRALVVGAGYAGCVYARMLREKGFAVTVVERAGFTGGGARTFFHGGHPYTFGPHYLNTPDEAIYRYVDAIVPQRLIDKINYSYQADVDAFVTFPIHADDVDAFPDAERIRAEIDALGSEAEARNFEEYWIARVGPTLYERYVKHYNVKAWLLGSNTEMEAWDARATDKVKVKPARFETGTRYEFPDYYQCYPLAADGYNRLFDWALEGCDVRLDTTVARFDLDAPALVLDDGERLEGDLLVSTVSPDVLLERAYGELPFVGRDFHRIVLPCEHVFPDDVYFVYYPGAVEAHTRVVEYKKFTRHESPNSLLVVEVPSRNGRFYPMIQREALELAQRYIDALPEKVRSVGRAGLYRYVDMSEITRHALDFRDTL